MTKCSLFKNLGLASRIYFNLRDYSEDVNVGLINVSKEDCERFGIGNSNLENLLSPEVINWRIDQAIKGMVLLDKYRNRLSKADLSSFTRITLPIVYEKPAKKYFEKILKQTM